MNNLPRQKLLEIIRRHGREIITEPRRCEGLMRDNFPAQRREIAVLTAALEERIPSDLLAASTSRVPLSALLARLAARLHDDVAMERTAARWTVHTWALALGVLTPAELDALEEQIEPADRIAARTPPQPEAQRSETRLPQSHAVTHPPPSPTSTLPPPPASPARSVSPSARRSFVVATDGSGDFLTLTDAIRRVQAGSRLVVRPGIYNEGIVLDKPLEIAGDGALEETIVRASASSCLVMQTDEATIRNLTFLGQARSLGSNNGFFAVDIPYGRLLLESCDISSDSLACIAIHNPTAAPVIRSCRIHHGSDSGVFAFDGAQGLIEACDIFENANVAVAITGGASTSVRDCHIHHGGDAGIVVWNSATNTIEGCDVYANRRANIGVSDAGRAILRRCRIHDGENTGVFAHRDGRATIEACNIYRHAAPEVAAESGADVSLRNCQIHDGRSHGLFIHGGGRALLEECDVFRNRDSGVHIDRNGAVIARACRINDNGRVGVSCKAGSVVEVEGCDLTQNRIAAWETNHGSQIVSRHNRL